MQTEPQGANPVGDSLEGLVRRFLWRGFGDYSRHTECVLEGTEIDIGWVRYCHTNKQWEAWSQLPGGWNERDFGQSEAEAQGHVERRFKEWLPKIFTPNKQFTNAR